MDTFSQQYQEHKIFEELNDYFEFYKGISFTVMDFITSGTKSFFNIDTYIFSSMQGTMESIKMVLKNGRINDATLCLENITTQQ